MTGYISDVSFKVGDGSHVLADLRATAETRGLPVSAADGRRFTVSIMENTVAYEQRENALSVVVSANTEGSLNALRDLVATQISELVPGIGDEIRWSGHEITAGLPKGFRRLSVIRKYEVFPGMLRIVFSAGDLAPYLEGGNHFGLLLQDDPSRNPVWPRVLDNGRTVWPQGDDALTRRVYTIRHARLDEGEIDVDFVLHEQGRATEWARQAQPGDIAGMLGPVGRRIILPDDTLFLAGDLTALPNIGRLLDMAGSAAEGSVILRAPESAVESGYLPDTPVKVRCMPPDGPDEEFIAAVRETCDAEKPGFAWFAGEKQTALALRPYFRDVLALEKKHHFSMPYWVRGEEG